MTKNIALLLIIVSFSAFLAAQPLADGRSKFLGCGTSNPPWSNYGTYWNQVTPGNDGKWGSVEVLQGQYNWTNLDNIYNSAIGKGAQYKHHTLVWGSQQPSWITSLDSAGQRAAVEKWIKSVGERYPKMNLVDVVNEPFHAPPAYKNAIGGDGKSGWDWVITSFAWARQYCAPGTKLLLNEYNVLHDNSVTNNYLRLIDTLKARNLIDGIGVQGHYFEFRSDISSPSKYVYDLNIIKANLNKLGTRGLPVYITEFDIDEPIDSNQVAQYKIYFPIFWDNPAVKGITFWGYVEGDIWSSHPNTPLLKFNGTERPAMQWLRSYVLPPPVPAPVTPVGQTDVPRNVRLSWRSCESATSYGVQISADSLFTAPDLDVSVTDTTMKSFPLTANKKYFWRVNAANGRDTSDFSKAASFTTGSTIQSAYDNWNAPAEFQLSQNFPNPFNPVTTISYSVPQAGPVTLTVYDVLGKTVATLVDGFRPQGSYSVTFHGEGLSSGVYLYRLQAGVRTATKKLILLQ